MNYIWSGIIIISFIFAAANGNITETLSAGLEGAKSSCQLILSFAGIMCFWSGILNIAKKGKAAKQCEKLLSPIVSRLFPEVPSRKNITMNMVANLLGMGNAATPAGVAAMEELDLLNQKNPHPSREMSRFAILNTSSLQLIPTTVIGILASGGAKDPFSIVPCIWISSALSLTAALFADVILSKRRKKR